MPRNSCQTLFNDPGKHGQNIQEMSPFQRYSGKKSHFGIQQKMVCWSIYDQRMSPGMKYSAC